MKLVRTLKLYGYIYFEPCHFDFISTNTKVKIFAGNQELIIRAIELQVNVFFLLKLN